MERHLCNTQDPARGFEMTSTERHASDTQDTRQVRGFTHPKENKLDAALRKMCCAGNFDAVWMLLCAGARDLKNCIDISIYYGHYDLTTLLLISQAIFADNIVLLEKLLSDDIDFKDLAKFIQEFAVYSKIRRNLKNKEKFTKVAIKIACGFRKNRPEKILQCLLLNTHCDEKQCKVAWNDLQLESFHNSWLGSIQTWVCDLNLSNNDLSFVPTDLLNMKLITRLNLSANKLQEITSELLFMENLQNLNISRNNFTVLPDFPEMNSLKSLNVSSNQLIDLPKSITRSSLEILNLSNNLFTEVPLCVCDVITLKDLDLSGNRDISCLPDEMGKLRSLYHLGLNKLDKINDPPEEIRKNAQCIVSTLRGRLRSSQQCYTMKLMVVGKSDQGKTALLHRLKHDGSTIKNELTQGVEISDLVIKERKKFTFKVWDFGGQEDYYTTHQCFLSKMSLYLLVWRLIDGEEGVNGLVPWLDNIAVRSPGSTVIIVGTFLDCISPDKYEVDYVDNLTYMVNSLVKKQRYRGKILVPPQGICAVSSLTGKNRNEISKLRHIIYDTAAGLKKGRSLVMEELIPLSFFGLIERIEKRKMEMLAKRQPPIIRREEFHAMVQENSQLCKRDIQDPHDAQDATVFLNERGIVIHFDDPNDGLHNLYFIDPGWLCAQMARVVQVKSEPGLINEGTLEVSHASLLFKDQFPDEFVPQIIRLLVSFQVVYSLDQSRLLIPSKLPETMPKDLEQLLLPFVPVRRVYTIDYQRIHGFQTRFMSRLFFYMKEMIAMQPGRYQDSNKQQQRNANYCCLCAQVESSTKKFLCFLDRIEKPKTPVKHVSKKRISSAVESTPDVPACCYDNDPTVKIFTEEELGEESDDVIGIIINDVNFSTGSSVDQNDDSDMQFQNGYLVFKRHDVENRSTKGSGVSSCDDESETTPIVGYAEQNKNFDEDETFLPNYSASPVNGSDEARPESDHPVKERAYDTKLLEPQESCLASGEPEVLKESNEDKNYGRTNLENKVFSVSETFAAPNENIKKASITCERKVSFGGETTPPNLEKEVSSPDDRTPSNQDVEKDHINPEKEVSSPDDRTPSNQDVKKDHINPEKEVSSPDDTTPSNQDTNCLKQTDETLSNEDTQNSTGTEKCSLCKKCFPADQLVTIPLDVAELLEKGFLTCWASGIRLDHPSVFLAVSCVSLANTIVIQIVVAPSPLGRRLLTLVVDHVDTLIKEWYPGVLITFSAQPTFQKLIPCRLCEQNRVPILHEFTVDSCVAQYSTSDYIKCPQHEIRIEDIAPDVVLNDLDSHFLVDEREIQYDKTNRLGSGAFGTVYRGFFRGKPAAIKEFSGFKGQELDHITQYNEIRKEVNVMRLIQEHPFLVNLMAVCLRPFRLVMELVCNGSLKTSLMDDTFFIDRIVVYRMIHQVSDALSFLHSLNVIYRDLNPKNVLVMSYDKQDDVNVKLTDFGTASFQFSEGLKSLEGTPGHHAPEMLTEFSKRRGYTDKVDVFSLGILVYSFITRRKPFSNVSSPAKINDMICQGEKPKVDDVVTSRLGLVTLTWLMEKCLQFDPNSRPTSKEIAAQVCSPPFQLLLGATTVPSTMSVCHVCIVEATRELWVAVGDDKNNTVLVYDLKEMHVKKEFTVPVINPSEPFLAFQLNCMHVTNDWVLIGVRGDLEMVVIYDIKTYQQKTKVLLREHVCSLGSNENYIFFGMPSGLLCIIPCAPNKKPETVEVTGKPITSIMAVDDYLWLTAENSIFIYNIKSGAYTRPFELKAIRFETKAVYITSSNKQKIWFTSQHSPVVSCWDSVKRTELYTIDCDLAVRRLLADQIFTPLILATCVVSALDTLWIGTESGMILIFDAHCGDLISWMHLFDDAVRTLTLVSEPGPYSPDSSYVIASGSRVRETALVCDGNTVCSPEVEENKVTTSHGERKVKTSHVEKTLKRLSRKLSSLRKKKVKNPKSCTNGVLLLLDVLPANVLRSIETKSTR